MRLPILILRPRTTIDRRKVSRKSEAKTYHQRLTCCTAISGHVDHDGCQFVPNPQAVSESESPVISADFLLSGDRSAGAEALLKKSCGRLDFLFLIATLFGGGILLPSFCTENKNWFELVRCKYIATDDEDPW